MRLLEQFVKRRKDHRPLARATPRLPSRVASRAGIGAIVANSAIFVPVLVLLVMIGVGSLVYFSAQSPTPRTALAQALTTSVQDDEQGSERSGDAILPTPTPTRTTTVTTSITTAVTTPVDLSTVTPITETERRPVRVHGIRQLTRTPTSTSATESTSGSHEDNDPDDLTNRAPDEEAVLEPILVATATSQPTAEPAPLSPPDAPLEINGLIITTPTPTVESPVTGTANSSPAHPLLVDQSSMTQSNGWAGELPSFAETAPVRMDDQYVVQEGDTLWSVSIEMGLDLAETSCAVAPDFDPRQPLVVGDVLEAPALGVRCHQVQEGESPLEIAVQYGVDAHAIAAESWNGIAAHAIEEPLPVGRYVRVPLGTGSAAIVDVETDSFLAFMLEQPVSVSPYLAYAVGGPRVRPGQEPVPAEWPYGSGQFNWPVYGWLSQGYRNDHRAIDIAAQPGTFVTAADRGVVIRAGWNNQGYGQFVVIDHNIDYITLYAHLDQVLVKEGEVVGQGQIVGTVGSTGNSTGPHLHFEIRDFGRRINPIELLAR